MDEIRQNGKTVLYSEDGRSIPMFFNNLTGKKGFSPGVIELCRNGKTIKQGVIPNVIP